MREPTRRRADFAAKRPEERAALHESAGESDLLERHRRPEQTDGTSDLLPAQIGAETDPVLGSEFAREGVAPRLKVRSEFLQPGRSAVRETLLEVGVYDSTKLHT